jgi:hypothetical protein
VTTSRPSASPQASPAVATGGYGPTPTPQPQPTEQWTGAGVLFRASFQIDGKQAYRLTNNQNQHVCYIVAQPGFNLEPYVNRYVNLYGKAGYCSETVRACYFAVRYAQPVQ